MTACALAPRHKKIKDRLEGLRREPLEPIEFCRKWVPVPEGERGWRKACIQYLAKVTGKPERTIDDWGADFSSRPKDVLVTLEYADSLLTIGERVGSLKIFFQD